MVATSTASVLLTTVRSRQSGHWQLIQIRRCICWRAVIELRIGTKAERSGSLVCAVARSMVCIPKMRSAQIINAVRHTFSGQTGTVAFDAESSLRWIQIQYDRQATEQTTLGSGSLIWPVVVLAFNQHSPVSLRHEYAMQRKFAAQAEMLSLQPPDPSHACAIGCSPSWQLELVVVRASNGMPGRSC